MMPLHASGPRSTPATATTKRRLEGAMKPCPSDPEDGHDRGPWRLPQHGAFAVRGGRLPDRLEEGDARIEISPAVTATPAIAKKAVLTLPQVFAESRSSKSSRPHCLLVHLS